MFKRSRLAAGVVAAVAAATVTVPAQATPAPPPGAGVTLLTGDHVTIDGDRARIRPGKGRERIPFRRFKDERGDLHVVPTDMQPMLSSGRLDPRLFDVSLLIRDGYDDASSSVTPLIVQSDVTAQGLSSIGASTVEVPKGTSFFAGARAAGTGKIWLDGKMSASLDRSVAQIGAPTAWSSGHTGKGATVAVLDSGVDATHPDLADAIVEAKNFTYAETGTDDIVGHGTHVAATITGSGTYQGVAPEAKLLVGKVLDDRGRGRESDIIEGMEWAAARADVVNMSLGSPFPTVGDDPVSQALNRLTTQYGALFVVAAGNSGPRKGTIGSPGTADLALTVGAVERDDRLADFSSRGPRAVDGAMKPDITAPGVDIVAARAKRSATGSPSDKHVASSGTSMAAPHIAGAAALLAAQHQDWTPQQLKAALMGTAQPHKASTVYEQGAGRVDVARAAKLPVTASVGSLSLGTARWPHHDDAPMQQKITYRNSGATPVTLAVASEVKDPNGKPAVAALASVSPSSVDIPAGGEASVTFTATTSVAAPDGDYGGTITARAGDTVLRTPVTFTKEVESYDVKMSFVAQDGEPAENYFYRFVSHDRDEAFASHDPSGAVTQRIPKGKYYYEAYVQSDDYSQLTEIVEPAFEVTGDATFANDGRGGEKPGFTVDKASARPGLAEVYYDIRTKWGQTGHSLVMFDFDGIRITPTKTSAPGAFSYLQTMTMGEPDGKGGFAGTPYLYHLGMTHDGGVPKGLHRTQPDRTLAVVNSVVAAHTPGTQVLRDDVARGAVPLRLTEYYTPGVPWYGVAMEPDGEQEYPPLTRQSDATPKKFKLGKTNERWNAAVFGPAFPAFPSRPERWASRLGDEVTFNVPMFTDQHPTHFGISKVASARTVLSRDGKVVAQTELPGYILDAVPPSKGRYQLHAEASRDGVSELSTKVSADWSFTSEHVAGDKPALLPLLAVRFAPSLDLANRTAAGKSFSFPVYVQRNGSAKVTDVGAPVVRVSYDDGATWRPVSLMRVGDRWIACVTHPKDAKFVSLKAQARDSAGNTVDQTIIRAYGLK